MQAQSVSHSADFGEPRRTWRLNWRPLVALSVNFAAWWLLISAADILLPRIR